MQDACCRRVDVFCSLETHKSFSQRVNASLILTMDIMHLETMKHEDLTMRFPILASYYHKKDYPKHETFKSILNLTKYYNGILFYSSNVFPLP